MKCLYCCFSAMILLTLAACSTLVVKSNFDREINFSKYRTFAFAEGLNAAEWPPSEFSMKNLVLKDLERLIERKLVSKGMRKEKISKADFVIAYHAGVEQHVDVHAYGYEYKQNWQILSAHRYNKGTLVIDFVDRSDRELFWRGWAEGVVGDRIESANKLGRAVEKIINNYPPG